MTGRHFLQCGHLATNLQWISMDACLMHYACLMDYAQRHPLIPVASKRIDPFKSTAIICTNFEGNIKRGSKCHPSLSSFPKRHSSPTPRTEYVLPRTLPIEFCRRTEATHHQRGGGRNLPYKISSVSTFCCRVRNKQSRLRESFLHHNALSKSIMTMMMKL